MRLVVTFAPEDLDFEGCEDWTPEEREVFFERHRRVVEDILVERGNEAWADLVGLFGKAGER